MSSVKIPTATSKERLASAGLLVQADHVSSRIAEPRGDLGRVGADWLHDLAPMRDHRVNRRSHAVHHNVKKQPRLCRGRAPQHPRPAHFAHRVVKRRAAIAALAVLPAEDLLVEVSRPRNIRGRHFDVTDLSIPICGSHHHSFPRAAILAARTPNSIPLDFLLAFATVSPYDRVDLVTTADEHRVEFQVMGAFGLDPHPSVQKGIPAWK